MLNQVDYYEFDWPISLWIVIPIFVTITATVFACYLSQLNVSPKPQRYWCAGLLTSLRLISLSILLWMLWGFAYVAVSKTISPVWICVDRSQSMLTADMNDSGSSNATRFVQSVATVEKLATRIVSRIPAGTTNPAVELFVIGAGVETANLKSLARDNREHELLSDQSRLGDDLQQLINSAKLEQPSAVIWFSDGHLTSGISLDEVHTATYLQQRQLPFFGFTVGEIRPVPTLRFEVVEQPAIVFVGDTVTLNTTLQAEAVQGAAIDITLTETDSGDELQKQQVTVAQASQRIPVSFQYTADRHGIDKLQLRGTIVDKDNFMAIDAIADILLQVRSEPIKVLFLAESYSYEVRFLKHFLQRTLQANPTRANVFKSTFMIAQADRRLVQAEPNMISFLPIDAGWWSQFDLCLAIDPPQQSFDATVADSLKTAVEQQGCGLIYVAGNLASPIQFQMSPWNTLLPIRFSPANEGELSFNWRETAMGKTSGLQSLWSNYFSDPSLIETLSQMSMLQQNIQTKSTSRVLFSTNFEDETRPGFPLLLDQFVGAGQVAFQSTDETYRWRNFNGSDALYQQYWTDLIAFVAKNSREESDSAKVQINFASSTWLSGKVINFEVTNHQATFAETDSLIANVSNGKDTFREISLQMNSTTATYFGYIDPLPPGSYELKVYASDDLQRQSLATKKFNVDPLPTEKTATMPDFPAMQRLSDRTGGMTATVDEWEKVFERLPAAQTLHSKTLPPKLLWNYPQVVLLLVSSLAAEWYLRSRWGLI